MLVPKLRFKREDGTEYSEWSLSEFGSFCKAIDIRTSDTETYPLYSLTIEDGVTPKTDRYVRDYLITKEGDSYKIVPNNAFVYNPMNLRFGAIGYNQKSHKAEEFINNEEILKTIDYVKANKSNVDLIGDFFVR